LFGVLVANRKEGEMKIRPFDAGLIFGSLVFLGLQLLGAMDVNWFTWCPCMVWGVASTIWVNRKRVI
jgi:hypothetical protein